MALRVNDWTGHHMHAVDQLEPDRIDRTYTPGRVRWMLENYHALLSPHIDVPEEEREIGRGHTTKHTQWWQSQVDRKADLDAAIEWLAEQGNNRARLLLIVLYTDTPGRTKWNEAAAAIAVSERQAYRIERQAVQDICWYLGGLRDV